MKQQLQNRKNLKLAVELEGNLKSGKLVFITHGLSGSKDQPHIKGIREAFVNAGFIVVSFDTAYSFGESEGDSVNATATSYVDDLEDVITWAEQQEWYKEPFVLAGHSLGGISSLVYAAEHPNQVSALLPMSTMVSGRRWYEMQDPAFLKSWKEKGYYFKESQSLPGKSGKVGYGLVEDLLKYDALAFATDIKCPVLLLVGSNDDVTTPQTHRLLHAKLGGPKELHIISGMEHTPRNQQEIAKIQKILKAWLGKL